MEGMGAFGRGSTDVKLPIFGLWRPLGGGKQSKISLQLKRPIPLIPSIPVETTVRNPSLAP